MVTIGECLDESVEVGLSKSYIYECGLPNFVDRIGEVVFYFQRTALSLHMTVK